MFRYIIVAGVVLVGLMTFQLYEVSYNTNDIRGSIKLLKAEISLEKEKINLLRVQLAKAKRPDNLKNLNDRLLQLQPQKVEQFISMQQMPEKVAVLLPEGESADPLADLLNDEKAVDDPIAALLNQ